MHPRRFLSIENAIPLLVGATVFLLALDGGAFSLPSRSAFAIAVWWAIFVAAVLGFLPARPWPRATLATAAFLASFAIWTGLSMAWAASAEKAFLELDRVLLYLGVFVLAAAAARSGAARQVSAGIALGIVGVAAIALVSRFFPDVVSPGQVGETVAAAQSRLSFPVDYWNGLAMLVALAVPLLLALAVNARGIVPRCVAVAPLPGIVSVIYLASSRGGFIVAFVGVFLFVALTDRRWVASVAAVIGAAGSVAAVLVFADRPALVDTPLESAARAQAGTAALLLVVVCVATGLTYALVRAAPIRRAPPAAFGWSVVGVLLAAGIVAALAARPVDRFEQFRRVPASSPTTIEGHLLSGSSTGRWQQWEAAVEQFQSEPLHGGGAGSYGAWWLQHGEIPGFVSEAHSLYVEVLGELGGVGIALLAGALALAFGTGLVRTLRAAGERNAVAGVTGAAGAYLVGAGIDWMWELTIVSVVGIACLGLAATLRGSVPVAPSAAPVSARTFVAVAAVAVMTSQGIALLADGQLRESKRAAARDDIGSAASAAGTAAQITPWAASPYLQLALVSETAGELSTAQRHLAEALRRDSLDWRLWLVATRLHVKQGDIGAARRTLARARRLNPHSPLLTASR